MDWNTQLSHGELFFIDTYHSAFGYVAEKATSSNLMVLAILFFSIFFLIQMDEFLCYMQELGVI